MHTPTVARAIKLDRLYASTDGARWWPKVDDGGKVISQRIWKCYGKELKRRFRVLPHMWKRFYRPTDRRVTVVENRRCGFTRPFLSRYRTLDIHQAPTTTWPRDLSRTSSSNRSRSRGDRKNTKVAGHTCFANRIQISHDKIQFEYTRDMTKNESYTNKASRNSFLRIAKRYC